MEIFIFLLAGFAITNAVVFLHAGSIIRRFVSGLWDERFLDPQFIAVGFRQKHLGRLIHCHACSGFWVGVLLSLLVGGVTRDYFTDLMMPVGVLFDGLILSGASFISWVLLRYWGAEEL